MAGKGKTVHLTAAQAVVKYLQVQYSERDGKRQRLIPGMFGIFGHGNVAGLGQALNEYGDSLPYYQPRNEQGMVHAACGFAKTTQRLQTLACTASIGPGSTNMITGAATATVNRLPVLLLPSDYYATRYQGPVLQQLEHPISADVSVNDCFRPVSRFFDRILRPEQLLTALPEAMRALTDAADAGAVTLAFPQDVQTEAYDFPVQLFEERTWHVDRRPAETSRIAAAVQMLKKARRPLLIAGGGVRYSEATKELTALAEALGMPLVETYAGKGSIPDADLHLGGIGISGTGCAARAAEKADLILAVGTRLSDCVTGSQSLFRNPDVQFISINVCGHDGFKNGALPITADAREALKSLLRAAKAAGVKPRTGYLREIAAERKSWRAKAEKAGRQVRGKPLGQGTIATVISEEAQAGDTIIAAAGTQLMAAHKLAVSKPGVEYQIEFGYSCMTHEIAAAIGVRLAGRKGEVIAYLGDGGYMMNPTELVTAYQEGTKITVVVVENHGFQSIYGLQMARAGRDFGNEFRARDRQSKRLAGEYLELDFAANAASMGALTWRAASATELRSALTEARAEKRRPCVIVVEAEPHTDTPDPGVWWDIGIAETSGDEATRKLKAADRRDEAHQRFHY
ncbi:MAG: 3D-(3,5/4)-trihydroxycyclohexane-1,2-dione acylhydrolase (decyclizing) [Gemmatimonadetes bacterium]|nr:3D-(3,5/4)-trihydroxycyclohexane-1,2-dione acylhydrolase (decyclizing) [Gemmatimonadota bacterium]